MTLAHRRESLFKGNDIISLITRDHRVRTSAAVTRCFFLNKVAKRENISINCCCPNVAL